MNPNFLSPHNSTTIAIIGGGFSGSLVATHLLKTATQPLTIKLIEPSSEIGKGLAYSTETSCHILNVSAGNMSAFPDDPDHLLRWLHDHHNELAAFLPGEINASTFIPRRVYGLYIQSILEEAEATAPSHVQLERLKDEVVAVKSQEKGAIVSLLSHQYFWADQIVLALGNLLSTSPIPQPLEGDERYLRNAWSTDALDNIKPDASVLLIGTGLTMIDMVLSLDERGHQGKIYAISRRGLFPQRHQVTKPYPAFLTPETAPRTIPGLMRRVREEVKTAVAQGYDWRSVIDSLRPITQQLWQQLPTVEQQRFLRHVTAYWDVHRHRIAQRVADAVDKMVCSGQLKVSAGRIRDSQALDNAVTVTICERQTKTNTLLQVSRLVNCTGIATDYRCSTHALIANLRSQGLIRPNPIGLGLDTVSHGAVLDIEGQVSTLLYTLGTPRKGNLWETIAVPELRVQAQVLAKTLLQSLPLSVQLD